MKHGTFHPELKYLSDRILPSVTLLLWAMLLPTEVSGSREQADHRRADNELAVHGPGYRIIDHTCAETPPSQAETLMVAQNLQQAGWNISTSGNAVLIKGHNQAGGGVSDPTKIKAQAPGVKERFQPKIRAKDGVKVGQAVNSGTAGRYPSFPG